MVTFCSGTFAFIKLTLDNAHVNQGMGQSEVVVHCTGGSNVLAVLYSRPAPEVGSTAVELVLPSCSGVLLSCIGERVGFHSRGIAKGRTRAQPILATC